METLRKQEEMLRKAVAKNREGVGHGFIGEPRQTLCTELIGDDTVIPDEAWAVHGEDPETEVTETGIFDCDSERDPRDPENRHVVTKNLSEEDFYPDRHDATEEEREMNRDPEWDTNRVAEAGANLMTKLELSPTLAMCNVVGAYMGRLECRMDGVIHYFLNHKSDKDVVEAALQFAGKIAKYFSEISEKAKKRLISDAQMEQQLQRRTDGPAYRLGEVIFHSNWKRLLRV